MAKINLRQWKLYRLLKQVDGWITQQQIYEGLLDSNLYPKWDGKQDFHNSRARKMMSKDVAILNDSDLPRIILSSPSGLKISSKDEYQNWSKLKWISLKKSIKRLAYKDYKAKMDGQMRIKFDEESEAKEYVESFKDSGTPTNDEVELYVQAMLSSEE